MELWGLLRLKRLTHAPRLNCSSSSGVNFSAEPCFSFLSEWTELSSACTSCAWKQFSHTHIFFFFFVWGVWAPSMGRELAARSGCQSTALARLNIDRTSARIQQTRRSLLDRITVGLRVSYINNQVWSMLMQGYDVIKKSECFLGYSVDFILFIFFIQKPQRDDYRWKWKHVLCISAHCIMNSRHWGEKIIPCIGICIISSFFTRFSQFLVCILVLNWITGTGLKVTGYF